MLRRSSKSLRKLAQEKDIGLADLQKEFANKIKRVQACTEARGHHFQHLL
jgi:hypothetical protein